MSWRTDCGILSKISGECPLYNLECKTWKGAKLSQWGVQKLATICETTVFSAAGNVIRFRSSGLSVWIFPLVKKTLKNWMVLILGWAFLGLKRSGHWSWCSLLFQTCLLRIRGRATEKRLFSVPFTAEGGFHSCSNSVLKRPVSKVLLGYFSGSIFPCGLGRLFLPLFQHGLYCSVWNLV